MYKRFIPLATSLLLGLTSLHSQGADDDFALPIQVDAKSQFVDGKNKTSLFRDDVLIVQGSLKITADEVEVIASDGEGREIFVARGTPASYSQTLEDGNPVFARANEIRYEVAARTISLTGNAELQQDTSMVKGDVITYDMTTEQLLATSNADSEESSGRVTTVFTPQAIRDLTQDDDQETDEDDGSEDNKE